MSTPKPPKYSDTQLSLGKAAKLANLGRPWKSRVSPRIKRVSILVTAAEHHQLTLTAQERKLKLTDLVRESLGLPR